MTSTKRLLMAVVLVSSWLCSPKGLGLQHRVGDSIWSIPPTNDFYANWSSAYTFHAQDTLYFEFDSGLYNVIQVGRGDFDWCTAYNAYNIFMDGPVVVTLPWEGVFYYICNVSNYCALGLKFYVIVDRKLTH